MPNRSDDSDWYYGRHTGEWECNQGTGDKNPNAQAPSTGEMAADSNDPEAYNNRFLGWECNSPDVPVDPPHVLTMVGLILIFVGGLIGFGLLIDVAPATAIKTWMMWGGGVGVVLGMALAGVSIYLDERRRPPAPPEANP